MYKLRKFKGFTFVEIIFALIVVIIMATGAFMVGNHIQQAGKTAAANADINAMSIVIRQHYFENGAFPDDSDQFEDKLDPWGNHYFYRPSTDRATGKRVMCLWSNGPNGMTDSNLYTMPAVGLAGDDIGEVIQPLD